jgi:hypothetical protein
VEIYIRDAIYSRYAKIGENKRYIAEVVLTKGGTSATAEITTSARDSRNDNGRSQSAIAKSTATEHNEQQHQQRV